MAAAIPPKVSKIVDVFVSIAAAVVIWGALRKNPSRARCRYLAENRFDNRSISVFSIWYFVFALSCSG